MPSISSDVLLQQCRQAASMVREATSVVALTGAGISVASGIPDFRSPGGLWSSFDPWQVCSTWALRHNPHGVWTFLLQAVPLLTRAMPNPAHEALADLERMNLLTAVITQNIDHLHQAAGSKRVVEFHGNSRRFYCMECGREYPTDHALQLTEKSIPWLCGVCDGLIRPDVVFFGESIPSLALKESFDLAGSAEVMLILGTSGEVAPANTLPHQVKARGGRVIEINLGQTSYGRLPDVRIDARVEEALPLIRDELRAGP